MRKNLDLRGTPCPINFVRCRLMLEKLPSNGTLVVDLDIGEPEDMVIPALEKEGYLIKILNREPDWLRISIASNAR